MFRNIIVFRNIMLGMSVVAAWLGLSSVSQAQVMVRVPFVRVWVGQGVGVRAPFVNLWVPPPGAVYVPPVYVPPSVSVGPPLIAPPPRVLVPSPEPLPIAPQNPSQNPSGVPNPAPNPDAPQPVTPQRALTISDFAKTFHAKEGSYEVTLLNPANNQPTQVRFTLPEGTPKRVIVNRRELEFVYGPRQFVRIQFDRDGAVVTSRN